MRVAIISHQAVGVLVYVHIVDNAGEAKVLKAEYAAKSDGNITMADVTSTEQYDALVDNLKASGKKFGIRPVGI
jgi:SepF-like predicted cell division protein (DUF552 family)